MSTTEQTDPRAAGYFIDVSGGDGDSLDLLEIVASVASSWKLLVAVSFLGAVAGAAFSLQLPNIYRAEVLVSVVMQGRADGGNTLGSQLGGIAALTGIDLVTDAQMEESFATLASRAFARDFIRARDLLPVLFAERWDELAQRWRDDEEAPTLEAAVTRFVTDVRSVARDRRTGLVTLAVEWHSPELAALWVNEMIEMVNERMRSAAASSAERNIEYLNRELAKTNGYELRQVIHDLIQAQLNNAMLASVQDEYAFRVIDAAVPPENKVSPRRTLMVLGGGVIGLLCGLIVLLLRPAVRGSRSSRETRIQHEEARA